MTFYWWKPREVGSRRARGRDFVWGGFPVALKSIQSAVCTFVLLPVSPQEALSLVFLIRWNLRIPNRKSSSVLHSLPQATPAPLRKQHLCFHTAIGLRSVPVEKVEPGMGVTL